MTDSMPPDLRNPPVSIETLRKRARRTYAWGRLQWAAIEAAPVALVALVAGLPGVQTSLALRVAALGFVVSWIAGWFRNAWGHGARIGAWFGLVPFASGVWMALGGHHCSRSLCATVCLAVGVLGGALWGLAAGGRLARLGRGATAAALLTALAVGALGCAAGATGSILGVAAGLALAGIPLAWRRLASRSPGPPLP